MIRSIKIVANCHCLPLADAFALCVPNVTTDFIDINFAHTPDMQAKITNLKNSTEGEVIFTQPISDRFDALATSALKARLGAYSVVTFTNIYFAGLHPDITYLGQFGSRVQNFFGPYHSKIVLFSFVTGRSIADCLGLFNATTFEKVGFLRAFSDSSKELLERETATDIQFAREFITMAQVIPTLYTINHPTGAVFLALAKMMAEHVGLPFIPFSPAAFQNHLSINYMWPIYDAVAEYNNLQFRSPLFFVNLNSRSSRSSNLEQFVSGCYESYSQADPNVIGDIVKKTPFFQQMVKELSA